MNARRLKLTAAAVVIATAIPSLLLEAVLYAGLTFTSARNVTFGLRFFLLFCCILDLPAYLIGIALPRVGAIWLGLNVTISAVCVAVMEFTFAREANWVVGNSVGLTKSVAIFIFFFGLRSISACSLWLFATAIQRLGLNNDSATARKGKLTLTLEATAALYTVSWITYLFLTWNAFTSSS
jgi:hypothetical protein